MNIGYDGKRAFQNKTGLGNYSRSLMAILPVQYPQHNYYLFTPKKTDLFDGRIHKNVHTVLPTTYLYKQFPGCWRRRGMVKSITKTKIDIYHGVSNELPLQLKNTGVKSVVTIHDLIFERFPETYHFDERYMHRFKIKQACKDADAIIAISEQTKADLINFYRVPENKIFISYQSCNPIFEATVSLAQKALVKKRYQLPDDYFLFVSSIAPRKNLIAICKALILLKDKMDIPLVVIGDGKKEKESAKKLMAAHGISNRLILLNEMPVSKEINFTNALDFPAIYQQATALVYPSIFEGFGLPLLEALWSGLPIISSNTYSLPEVAGEAALYFDPHHHEQLAQHLWEVANNTSLAESMQQKGLLEAQRFTTRKYADTIMNIYQQLL